MKKKSILLLVLVLMLSFCVLACKKDKDNPDDNKPEETTETINKISDVLKDGKNNDAIIVEGVVYGVISNGFYMADSAEGRIFVVMGDDWKSDIKVGDKVKVTGKFGYVSNFPQVKNVSEAKVLSSGNDSFVKATQGTVADVLKLDSKARTGAYFGMYTLLGTIYKNNANIITLKDDNNNVCYFNAKSNVDVLNEFLDKRVTITVIVHNFGETWNVSFAGTANDIVKNELSFETIKEAALTHINEVVKKEVFGRLSLPSNHPDLTYITYTWSVDDNPYISITDNVAVVNIDEVDHEVTLKVTISNGEKSETVEYRVISKAIEERDVKDLFNGELAVNYSTVKVRGIVVGKSRNQSLSIRSLIVKDMNTNDITTFDFGPSNSNPKVILHSDDAFKNVAVGDEIVVMGELRNGADDRTCVTNIISLTVEAHNKEWSHDFENAYVLDSKESYEELGQNVKKYENKLVKLVNPYVCYSTTSTPADTNWLILSHSSDVGERKFGTAGKMRSFAFLLACVDENLGGTAWRDAFEFPFFNQESKQFDLTIYAYAMYVSDSYLAFIVPDQSCFIASEQMQVELAIGKDIPSSIEGGTVTLPKTHELVTGEITWTSNNAAIDVATGAVSEVAVSTTVTLTATYKIGDKTYTSEFKVEVLAATPMSVSEVLALTEDKKVKVQGIIVAYVSDGNTQAQRMGVLIMDPTTKDLVMVDGLSNLGGSYGAYIDSEGHDLKVGDMIVVNATYHLDSAQIGTSGPAQTGRHHVEVASSDTVVRTLENQEIVYGEPALTIDSNEKMTNLANNIKDNFGKLIKIVGTKEAPIYLGGSASGLPFNIKVFMNNASDNNGTKYGPYTFVLKTDVNTPNGGSEDWYKTLFGFEGAFIGPNATQPAIPWVGTLYVIVAYNTSTYYQMSIVNYANCQGAQDKGPETIAAYLVSGLPKTVESGAWTVELPTTYEGVESISWASGSELIDLTNKKVGYVDEDTEVTITGTYKVEGVEYPATYKVTIKKSTTKAEVETALKVGIPTELFPGDFTVNLVAEATGASNISWASSNEAVINLTTKKIASVASDTEVKLTCTYTFREKTETLEVTVTVKKVGMTEEEVAATKAAILTAMNATDGKITVSAAEAGTINLPAKANNYDLTWSSSNAKVVANSGSYGVLYFEKKVTLSATFAGGVQEIEVTLTPATAKTIEEVKEAGGDVDALRCVLISFTGKSSLTQDGAVRYFHVSDGKYFYAIDGDSSSTEFHGNISSDDMHLVVTLDDEDITLEVGDELVLTNISISGNKITLKDDTVVYVGGKVDVNAEGWFDPQSIKATITNDEELNALASSISTNNIYKIVATEENPIYFNGYNSSDDLNKNFFAFYYLTDEEKALTNRNACATIAPDKNGADKPFFLGGSFYPTVYNLGEDWVINNFYPEGTTEITTGILYNADTCPQETFKFTGTFYVMAQYRYNSGSSACYVLFQILLPGMNLTKVVNNPS